MTRVAYLYNQQFSNFNLSKEHPMKPMRLKMVNSLVNTYGLSDSLVTYHSKQATFQQLCQYHHPSYIKYLQTWVNPHTTQIVETFKPTCQTQLKLVEADFKLGKKFKINHGFDCPGFEGLYNYSQLAAGSSIDAANLIITGQADIVINWMGGFHHAKAQNASGFCYINDIVLCILELLKFYPRVLYLDIDVHHGDGVEEAFYHTNRVMTVSFHQYEKGFFPHTGDLNSIGQGIGKHYSVNVPLKRGTSDNTYIGLFKRTMEKVYQAFRPDVIVVQCGADSLSRDQLGPFNMSIRGHGQCLSFMKKFNTPLIVLGGGGYTIQNVARCWAYETALLLGQQIEDDIPAHDKFRYFYGQGKIHFDIQNNISDTNSKIELNEIEEFIDESLRRISPTSVAFHEVESTKKRRTTRGMMNQRQGPYQT